MPTIPYGTGKQPKGNTIKTWHIIIVTVPMAGLLLFSKELFGTGDATQWAIIVLAIGIGIGLMAPFEAEHASHCDDSFGIEDPSDPT